MSVKFENTESAMEALRLRLAALLPEPGKFPTKIEGLFLYKRDEDSRIECFSSPCVGIIAQGAKRALISNREYRYSEGHYVATAFDSPSVVHILGSSPETPHLAMAVALDRYALNQLVRERENAVAKAKHSAIEKKIVAVNGEGGEGEENPASLGGKGGKGGEKPASLGGEGGETSPFQWGDGDGDEGGKKPVAQRGDIYSGVTVGLATPDLLGACLRLLNLLDTPEKIPVLAPMVIREIHYCLLIGPEGERFRRLGTEKTPCRGVAQAIGWIREHYKERFLVSELAGRANMTAPTFHRAFKKFTGMSPVQFQKALRLYEAQLLMLSRALNSSGAAYEVGYESPTQFNREYKRLFGATPRADIKRLRESAKVVNGEIVFKE